MTGVLIRERRESSKTETGKSHHVKMEAGAATRERDTRSHEAGKGKEGWLPGAA